MAVGADGGHRSGAAAGDEVGDLVVGHDDLVALVGSHGRRVCQPALAESAPRSGFTRPGRLPSVCAHFRRGELRAAASDPRRRPADRLPSAHRGAVPSGRWDRTPTPRPPRRPCDRVPGRDAGHAGSLFGRTLRPAAPTHLGQRAFGEGRRGQHRLLGGRVAVGQQHPCPEPAVIGSRAPTGTVSRRPAGGSSATTHTGWCPHAGTAARSPVVSRRPGSTAAPAASRGSGLPADNSLRGRPETPAPGVVTGEQTVHLQSGGQPVRGGPGRPVRAQRSASPQGTRRPRAVPPRLCPERRYRYPVSYPDTNVPLCGKWRRRSRRT